MSESAPPASPARGREPRPITRPENHDRILAMALELPRGRALDAPCGEGALALRLAQAGFEVSCADVDPSLLCAPGLAVRVADLNEGKLPFEDERFELVVSVNGLHRLWNPAHAVREYARVLTPGGALLCSVPNYAHLSRRVRFLLGGGIARNISRLATEHDHDQPTANFRQPLLLSQILDALDAAGLEFASLETARPARRGLAWRVLAGAVRLFARFSGRRNREAFASDLGNSDAVLLGSHHLYLRAHKPAARPA